MGFLDDIWEKVKEATAYVARESWESAKDAARHEWERRTATVPLDVQSILDATPETETPVILYRDDTIPFLDDLLHDPHFEQGWAPGTVKGRPVRILLPSKDAIIALAAAKLNMDHQHLYEEMRKNAEVPQDVRDSIDRTALDKDPVIKHREELGIYVDSGQDLSQVLEQGYFLGEIHGRRVCLDIRHLKSEIREHKKIQDELKRFYKSK